MQCGAQCPEDSFNPISPTTISAALATRATVKASPIITIPKMNAPTAPIPVHTAYAVPSGNWRMAMASSTKLPSAVTTVNTDGQSRGKPSEVLRPAAHATSSKPAINRRIQDMRQLHGQMGPSPFVKPQGRPYEL